MSGVLHPPVYGDRAAGCQERKTRRDAMHLLLTCESVPPEDCDTIHRVNWTGHVRPVGDRPVKTMRTDVTLRAIHRYLAEHNLAASRIVGRSRQSTQE